MYIVKYSERVHMARMHELASASPPYERVPNILRYTFNNLFIIYPLNGYFTIDSALFCFDFFTSAHEDKFHLYPRSRAICKQLLNHGGNWQEFTTWWQFTKCSGCLPSILIVDNCIFLHFGGRLDCVAHRFARCPFRFSFRRQTQEIPMARKWITICFNSSRAREFPD